MGFFESTSSNLWTLFASPNVSVQKKVICGVVIFCAAPVSKKVYTKIPISRAVGCAGGHQPRENGVKLKAV